jgi:hypothetical protein
MNECNRREGTAHEENLWIEGEDNWETVCERHTWHCSSCGENPTYAERAIFFLRGLCGKCDFSFEHGA